MAQPSLLATRYVRCTTIKICGISFTVTIEHVANFGVNRLTNVAEEKKKLTSTAFHNGCTLHSLRVAIAIVKA